jgi:hypothetical protein
VGLRPPHGTYYSFVNWHNFVISYEIGTILLNLF